MHTHIHEGGRGRYELTHTETHKSTDTQAHAHTHTCRHTHTHRHTHPHIDKDAETHTGTDRNSKNRHRHSHRHSHRHRHMQPCTHTPPHTPKLTRTHTHTHNPTDARHAHTQTHTQTNTKNIRTCTHIHTEATAHAQPCNNTRKYAHMQKLIHLAGSGRHHELGTRTWNKPQDCDDYKSHIHIEGNAHQRAHTRLIGAAEEEGHIATGHQFMCIISPQAGACKNRLQPAVCAVQPAKTGISSSACSRVTRFLLPCSSPWAWEHEDETVVGTVFRLGFSAPCMF